MRIPAHKTIRPKASPWTVRIESAAAHLPVILNAETLTLADIYGERFHQTPSHELVHVQQGRAEIQFGRQSFQVGPEDSFIIPEGLVHRDRRSDRVSCRFTYVFFKWDSGEALLREIEPAVYGALPTSVKAHLHFLIGDLEREYLSEEAGAAEHLRVLLLEILLAILRHARHAAPVVAGATRKMAEERRHLVARDARQYLLEHFAETVSLDALAVRFDVSPFHLSRTFSREFGMGLSDMLTMIRIEHARELLKNGSLSVKEIAVQVGYGDGNYFAKVFRRVSGVSPSEYQIHARGPEK